MARAGYAAVSETPKTSPSFSRGTARLPRQTARRKQTMDILCGPATPSRSPERAKYLCGSHERWDGGPFLTYLDRRTLTRSIPVPFSDLRKPADLAEEHAVYTTWLFFGLLAEFLGLNGAFQPNTRQLVDDLYQTCITIDQDGIHYLTGRHVPSLQFQVVSAINANADMESRLSYLFACAGVSNKMLCWTSQSFERGLKFAISALGEFLTNVIISGLRAGAFGTVMPPWTSLSWKMDYLDENTPVQQAMMDAGWCRSDLYRINALYASISSAYHLSMLDRRVPGRDHSRCSETKCHAAQIDSATYKLSHTASDCNCREFRVDTSSVHDILLETETYPVLVFDPSDETALTVKPFTPGDDYVAISHVCQGIQCRVFCH